MDHKTISKLMALLLIVALLAGCAPAATPAPAQPAATEAPAQPAATEAPAQPAATEAPAAVEPLPEIVVACWSGPEHDNLVKVAAEYEKRTGNKVIVEEIAREAYFDKLTTTFIGGGSDYDAAYIMSDWPPAWVKAGALHPLNEYIDDPKVAMPGFSLSLFGAGVDPYTFDGKVYAFPSEGDTAWLWYRADLLDAKGIEVPETWDEYLAAAQALTSDGVYGTVIGAKPDEAMWDFMYYLFGMGGGILDENNKVIFNNEAGVQALTFYADLRNKYKVVPPDVVTYGYNEIQTALQEGKVAMGIEWMAATATLQDCEQSPKVCIDGKTTLQYAIPPGIKEGDGTIKRTTGGSQWGWGIPAGAKNPEAAYKFIEWLTSKDGAILWALNGGIPGNTEALSDSAVVAEIPQFKLLAEVMPFRQIIPPTTVTADLVTIMNEAVVAAVAETKSPQEAMDEAAAKMKEMLEKAGYPQ